MAAIAARRRARPPPPPATAESADRPPTPPKAAREDHPSRRDLARERDRRARRATRSRELDKRIIEHLQQDGRRPFTQIAAELGVSEAAVRARTNRLVERGILQVVGVTDPLKLGFQQMAMIGIRCEGDRLMTSRSRSRRCPRSTTSSSPPGTYDILIETVCEDNEALLRFLAERLRDHRRRPRDRNVRLPADGQADVPVGDALGRRASAGAHRIAARRAVRHGIAATAKIGCERGRPGDARRES